MTQDNAANTANASSEDVEVIENEEVQSTDEGADKSGSPDKDKQIDNAEASRIGRMVAKQLEKVKIELDGKYGSEINSLKATVESYKKLSPQAKDDDEDPPPVEGFPTTPDEFIAMKNWADNRDIKKTAKVRQVYTNGYISAINTLREEGGDLHAQIQELLTKDGSPYNVTHGTGKGDADATINYYRAKSDIIANKIKTPSNPFKGKQSDVATGVTASSRVPASKSAGKITSDDPKTNEFMDYLGWDDKKRAEFISQKG